MDLDGKIEHAKIVWHSGVSVDWSVQSFFASLSALDSIPYLKLG
jgi:hypothetical protein